MANERVQDGPASRRREGFEVLAARLSRILGACDLETLDAAVEECLEQLGRHLDTDVAFLVLTDDDERVVDDWRWVGVGETLVAPERGSLLRDTFGSAIEFLRLGHTVAIDDLAGIDLSPSERTIADANGLRAIVMAPVQVGSTLLGIVGVQVLGAPRPWPRGDAGNVELVAGLLVKTVIRTRNRGALAAADARARRIAEFLPDGLLLLDRSGAVNFASPSFVRATGTPASDLVGTRIADLVHPEDQPLLAATMAEHALVGAGLVVRMRASDDWCWSELSWQLIHEPDAGVPDEIVVSIRDVHEKLLAAEHLSRELERDALTGLLDRRGLERAIAGWAPATAISIGFVDIDQFKAVNDTHGHDAGDEVLRAVGTALAGAVRRGDVVARIGGDEFCVVARADGASREGSAALGERLLRAVDAALAGRPDLVTVSIGVAGPAPATIADELRVDADAAMYRAKRAGGGRFALGGASTD